MTEQKKVEQPFDMTQVNGVAVIERTKAKMTDGNNPGSELRDVDEVLLADDSVVYQCVSRAGGCGEVWPQARSVLSHLKVHQGVFATKRVQQELAEVSAENERLKRVARESDRRRAKRDTQSAEGVKTERVSKPLDDDTRMARTAALDEIARGSDLVEEGLKIIEVGAVQLANMAQPIDPTIVEKAAKWDNMKKMLS